MNPENVRSVIRLVNSRAREKELLELAYVNPRVKIIYADEDTPERLTGYCGPPQTIIVDDFATLSWPVVQVLQGYHANGAEIIIEP